MADHRFAVGGSGTTGKAIERLEQEQTIQQPRAGQYDEQVCADQLEIANVHIAANEEANIPHLLQAPYPIQYKTMPPPIARP